VEWHQQGLSPQDWALLYGENFPSFDDARRALMPVKSTGRSARHAICVRCRGTATWRSSTRGSSTFPSADADTDRSIGGGRRQDHSTYHVRASGRLASPVTKREPGSSDAHGLARLPQPT